MSSDKELSAQTSSHVNDLLSGAYGPMDSEDDTRIHHHDPVVSGSDTEDEDLGILGPNDTTTDNDNDDLGVSKASTTRGERRDSLEANEGIGDTSADGPHEEGEGETPISRSRSSPRTVRDFTPREGYSYAEVDALVSGISSDRLRTRYRCMQELSGVARARKWKAVVGNRLGRKGIAIIFRELGHEDRGVRTTAARLIADLAYQSVDNQQLIAFHSGYTVGNLRIYAVSDDLRRKNTRPGQEDMQGVLEDLTRVYPDAKNPRFWCYPPFSPTLSNVFPDPAHHFIGYTLVENDSDTENQHNQANPVGSRRPQSGAFVRRGSPLGPGSDLPPHPRSQRGRQRPLSAHPGTGTGTAGAAGASTTGDDAQGNSGTTGQGSQDGTSSRPQSARARMDGNEGTAESARRPASGRKKKANVFSRLSASAKARPQSARVTQREKASAPRPRTARPASQRKKTGSGTATPRTATPVHAQPPRPQTAAVNGQTGRKQKLVRGQTARGARTGPGGPGASAGPRRPSSGAARPKSAPSFRRLVRRATNVSKAGTSKPPPRSQLTKAFWESIELATQTSANSINVHATLNMQLHPAVATYRWSSKSAQQRILNACSETADAKGNFSAIDRRQSTAQQAKSKAGTPWASGRPSTARSTSSRPATAGRLSKTLNTQSLATPTATERRQFAVDIYSSPFTGGTAADPSRTMLDFQSMLIRTEEQPKKQGGQRIRKTDTVVGLPVPGASMSSGSFTLDKMALREMRKMEREAKAAGRR